MEVATTTTEATLSAIHESLVKLTVSLGRIAARQETMLADLKKTTAALAPTAATTPVFMLGRVPEQQATKPSSPSIISAHRVVATAALQTGTVLTSFAPTRYSTICSTVNVGSNHAAVAFPISGTELKVDDKLTHVGGLSLFLELDLDSANKVFEDDGFTTVGGVSLFLDLEMKFEVLTCVGDCSIFLEPGMGNPTEMVAAPSNVDMDKVFDPGGSRFLCWVLHNKIVAANITLSFLNLLIHLHVWEDGRSTALAMELYVQWDPGIIENVLMTAMFVQLAQKTESKEKKIYAKFFVSSRVEVNPDCLSIILAKFDTCSVEWYASYKCIFNITHGVVCILLSLTLSDVVCMIQESFGLSPLDMFQNLYLGTNIHIYEGSVCMIVVEFTADKQHTFGGNSQCAVQLHGHFMLGCPCLISVRLERTSQYMVVVMEVLAYWCSVEVQATYPSAHTVLVDFSLVPRSTAATALTGLFQCVNLQNQIGQWDSLFQEGMVHRNQLKAGSGCYFHMQSRSFGFNIPQICNVSTLDGLPWDPGGVHISKIHAIAWGQAIFCGGGSVTPDAPSRPNWSYGLLYVGLAQLIKHWSGEDKEIQEVSVRGRTEMN